MKKQISAALMALMLVMQLMASGFMMPLNAIAAENAPVAENSSVSSNPDATNETSDQSIKDESTVETKAEAPKTDEVKNTSSEAEAGHQEAVIDDAAEVEENKEATTEESTSEEKVLSEKDTNVVKAKKGTPESIVDKITIHLIDEKTPVKPGDVTTVTEKSYFKITYDFLIPINTYISGDQVTYELPKSLDWDAVYEKDGDLGELGEFKVHDGKVTFTFNEKIENDNGSDGTPGFIAAGFVAESNVISQETTSLDQSFTVTTSKGEETYYLHFDPKNVNNNLTKNGVKGKLNEDNTLNKQSKAPNAIEWTVEFNKTKNKLTNGIFTDSFNTKELELVEGTFKAIELKVDRDGKITEGDDATEDFTSIGDNKWSIKDGSNKAYRITYITKVKDETLKQYTNKATVTAEGINKSDTKTLHFERKELLKKSGEETKTGADWTIEYNYGQVSIPKDKAVLKDVLEGKHDFDHNSVKIYPVTIDGENQSTVGTTPIDSSKYVVEYYGSKNKWEMHIKFQEDVTSAYQITYSTKLDDPIVSENLEVNNTVTTEGGHSGQGVINYQQAITKWVNDGDVDVDDDVDYDNQTITWRIGVNAGNHDMGKSVIKDVFTSKNMKYVKNSAKFSDGTSVTVKETKEGLEFTIPATKKALQFSYQTKMVNPYNDKFVNTATLHWNGLTSTAVYEVDVPNEIQNNGYKQGSKEYNEETGEYTFKWQVGFNLNKKGKNGSLTFKTIEDEFVSRNMEIVPGSLKIVEVDLKKDKTGRTLADPLKELSRVHYTVKHKEHGFTVTLQAFPPNKAYALVYETKDSNGHYSAEYKNKATSSLFDKTGYVEDTVNVDNGKYGISKNGGQVRLTRNFDYSVDINKSKSILKNAYVTDELKALNKLDATYVEDSFKLDGDSNKLTITKDAKQKADDSTYYLYVNEDKTSFKLIFPKSIHTTHNLSYKVYYEGDKNSVLSNSVNLNYDNMNNDLITTAKKDITYENSGKAFGWGKVSYKDVYIKKVDSVTGKLLKGAEFELYKFDDLDTVYRTATTDENGIAVFKNVRLSDENVSPYAIREAKEPKNYIKNPNKVQVEFAVENRTKEKPFVIKNDRAACEVTVSFINAKDKEKISANGTYKVFTKDKVETNQKVEFKNGEAKVGLKPGTYFIKQDGDIKGFAPVNEFTEIKVEEDENGDCKVTTVNVELAKVCETVILNTDKDTKGTITANSEYKVLKDGKEFNSSVKSDNKGNINLGKLENGKYELVQTKAPEGYVLNKTPLEFTVDVENCVTDLKFENEVPKCAVTVINEDETGKVIKEGSTYNVLKDGNVIVGNVKAVDGKLTLEPLPAGDYKLVQVTVDDMYVLNETGVDFTVDPDNCDGIVITNKFAKCEITVINKDENGDVITDGSTYKVMQGSTQIDEPVTAVDGQLKLPALKHGTYQLVQTDVSDKYVLNKTPIEFKINKDECAATVTIVNEIAKCDITVINKDVDGGKIKDGSEYDVYQIIGDEKVKVNKEPLVSKNGEVKVPALVVGKYELVQTKVDSIYVLNEKPVAFEVVKDNCKVVNITNEFAKCEITVINKDNKGQVITDGSEYKVMQGEREVAKATAKDGKIVLPALKHGDYTLVQTKVSDKYVLNTTPIKFTIDPKDCSATVEVINEIAKCDITVINNDVDGKKITNGSTYDVFKIVDGQKVKVNDNPFTAKDGSVKVPALEVGKYELVQKSIEGNYVLNETSVTFEVVKDNCATVTIVNDFGKCEVTIINKDGDPKEVITSGSEYTLYKKAKDGSKVEITSGVKADEAGKIVLPALERGDYVLVQTKAPQHYEKAKDLEFTVNALDCSPAFEVENIMTYCPATIVLVDKELAAGIEGAKFVIKDVNGKVVGNEFTFGKDGKITTKPLRPGTYTIELVKGVPGYKIAQSTTLVISPDQCGGTISVNVDNTPNKCDVTIFNKDEKGNVIVENSTYKVEKINADGSKTVVVANVKANKGKIVLDQLRPGNYVITQTTAPKGYKLNTTPLKFTVKKDECLAELTIKNGKVPPVVGGETEEGGKPPVTIPTEKPDVDVDIIDKDKKPVDSGKTDGNGNLVIDKLPPGKYEIVDKDKNVIGTIVVDKNGNVLPQTGESNTLAYGLGGLLVFALGAYMVVRNRRKHA